jgi:LysM repeat protein
MPNKLQDPRYLGFIIGFSGVALIGLIVIASLVLPPGNPVPTLAASAIPISEYATAVPPASEPQANTPPPGSEGLPAPTSLPTATELSPTSTRSQSIEHTVREGDTLSGIALTYDVSIETIQEANNLTGETILPGQVLVIPPGPLATPTPYIEDGAIIHTVSSGDTLIGIAKHYSVTVETIQAANSLDSETILPGQKLRVPAEGLRSEPAKGDQLPTSAITASATDEAWQPSILEGNLAAAYPLTLERERFTMHYQPDTPAARAPNKVAALVESALDHIEKKLRVTLEHPFDVYIAGSLFAPDDTALRGRSFSAQRRNFYLYDDTGTPEDQRYIITHELTHLVAWNTISRPSSVMLHEGLAVYTGIEAMEAAGFIPLRHFCAAYNQTGQLPPLTGSRPYLGHIRDLDLYFTAGCFTTYLIDEYGIADFKRLFTSGDYPGIYGHTLSQLEEQWTGTLEAIGDDLTFDPEDLVASLTDVTASYDRLFANFGGTPPEMAAYRALDQARIAMLQARFEDAQEHLDEFEALLKE